MDFDTLFKLCYVAVPILSLIVGFSVREQIARITRLEQKMDQLTDTFVSKDQLREALVDKIEPVREDIKEIKDKLDQLYNHLLRKE